MMEHWKRQKITLSFPDWNETVEAPTFNGLAMVLGDDFGTAGYSVTHINTGHRIVFLTGDFVEIWEVADELAKLTDWSAIKTVKQARSLPALQEMVLAILRKYGDD